MTPHYIVCLVIVIFAAIGCGSDRSRTVRMAEKIGINELRADLLTTVYEKMQSELPQAAWPETVRRLQPLAVQKHMGGILIVTSRIDREQAGLLIMLDPEDNPGAGGSGISYQRIRSDGVFWCVEKIRDQYSPPDQRTNR